MRKIEVLANQVVQQIAAGEVVQRPASVVKELIENSLDADARRIELELEDAGCKLIAVRDDGIGMSADNAVLALERHATSKISSASDLLAIRTLGFRGEALPSIAAVSQFELITATKDALAGVRVITDGGSQLEVSPCQAVAGTWISVRNLFFNTPARFKFLKSKRTELRHITEVVTRMALVRPDVSFRAFNQGRELITTSGSGERKEVVELILGKGTFIPWLEIDTVTPVGSLSGYVAPPELARRSRNHQIIIINGRWVKSPLLLSAVETAFEPQLVRNCHPVFCLELEVEPELVDINVHPAKLEVRLSKEREIWQFVHRAVKTVLQPRLTFDFPPSTQMSGQADNSAKCFEQQLKEPDPSYITVTAEDLQPSAKILPSQVLSTVQSRQSLSDPIWPQLTFIGQVLQTYLVLEGPNGIYLLDQHAAHERVLYEQIGETWNQSAISLQHLLVPYTFDVTETELALWKQRKELWQETGIVLERFGPRTLALRSIPQIMSSEAAITLTQELLNEESDPQDQLTWEQQRQRLQVTLACHAAIRAGQSVTVEDANLLLTQLSHCQHPYNCPHGRPTLVWLSRDELDRRFRRRVT
ncbi:MAG: DNA mismatch repair endonuclease MutL [bacterium]